MSVLRLSDFNSPVEFYENRFMYHGMSSGYGGHYSNKEENFCYHLAAEKMLYHNSMDRITILDVGSGLGNFYKFLKASFQKKFYYTGVDFNEKVNQIARLHYNDETFKTIDFLDIPNNVKYDFVYCFGIIGYEEDFLPYIERCYSLCRTSFAIQVFVRHPYLRTYDFEYQSKMIKPLKYINGFRHSQNSIIWFGKR